ncbi:MAG: hypothetical protein KF816_14970 [Melioribacteraceae bacterium]|nr:hypothetical protein [Melioribacteraceae bacterium]
MHYILFYKTVENYVERRAPFRVMHLAYAQEYVKRGELIMAGAFDNPVDGAALVFNCETETIPQEFAKNDPYVINGLISEWYIRAWNVVLKSQ